MVMYIIALLLTAASLFAVLLEKTYFTIPAKELKRRAAHADRVARTLYRAAAYGAELKLILWFVLGLAAAGGFLIFARVAPWELGLLVMVLVIWLGFVWLPRARLSGVGIRLAQWCTPGVVAMLRWLHPMLRPIETVLRRYYSGRPNGIYEREDLYALLAEQEQQEGNRITDHELQFMRQSLRFGDYEVHEVMTPRARVVAVGVNEIVSLVFLDDLHKSEHSYFPVYDGKRSNLVGTLSLDVVTDIRRQGTVRDFYDRHLAYVHERDGLEQALLALYDTGQHILVVLDTAGAYVGIVTLGDILHCLFEAIGSQPGRHDDRQTVAGRHLPKHEGAATTETLPPDGPEVVE